MTQDTQYDRQHYEAICEQILAKAKNQGATNAEVNISLENGIAVASRLEQVDTVEHHTDKGFSITVYFDQQTGSASSSDLSPAAIDLTVEKACNIAKFTSGDPYAGLPNRDEISLTYPQVAIDYPWDIDTGQALDLAIQLEHVARQDKRITNSEGAFVNSHRNLQVYANSLGFLGSFLSTQHSMHCVLIAQANDEMHRDYDYSVVREAADFIPIEQLANQAVSRTVNRLGARRLKTQSAPVIFDPQTAKTLLNSLVSAISGGSIYRKSSFLVDALDKKIFPDHIVIKQYPHLPKGIATSPFDSEGIVTREQAFVQDGVLTSYILSSYSARKLGLKTTGNAGGVFNLVLQPGQHSFTELLKEMDTGFLVTELIGQGINLVTGDYSRGAFGYWVERGEIQYPVNEVTIAGNLQDIFMNISAVGNDLDTRGKIQTGSILVNQMMIAGE